MEFFHNIATVSKYEAKTLRRSWFFRLFSIGAISIFTFMNIGLYSPVGNEQWSMIAIPSTLPLISLYLLNIGQALVVIFLAADFLRRDKKLDTNEVLYTRPMSNLEYVTGKTLGILRLFLTLDLLILSIGLVINIISKRMTIDLLSYVEYLLIICVPTILFSLGLAFMLMSVIRNQAITFLLLLGYAALDIFYLYWRLGSVFDYMAFGLPVFKSGMIGFDDLSFIVNQRLIYFFLGLSMVFATIVLFKRLPQSKIQRSVSWVLMFIFLAGAGVTFYKTLSEYQNEIKIKDQVVATNRLFENRKFASTTNADIDVVHKGKTIDVIAGLRIINDNNESLESYLFSLNPGLKVTGVTSGGKEVPFSASGHIIEIRPGKPLEKGESDSLTIVYSGYVSEEFCYPDYKDNIKENPYRIAMVNVNKRQAFLRDDYVLLTPETHWYPVPGLNYYPSNPAGIKVSFTRFKLKAGSDKGLVAVSQGQMKESDGKYVYDAGFPLTGLTLAMGNYISDTLKIDSVELISWHYKGNDYYKKDLSLLNDTLKSLVSGIMRELETNFSTKYPFSSLSIVEAPVQFYSYPRVNTQTRAELQPSMVIVPERLATIEQAGFGKRFTRQKRQMERNNQVITDKELQVRLFNNFVRNTFISGESFSFKNGVALNEPVRFRLGPSFYFFRNNFYSDDYPVINAAIESHLQKLAVPGASSDNYYIPEIISENDKANMILKNKNFRELMAENPGYDTIRTILTLKGDYYFNFLRQKAGIAEFNSWFLKYLNSHIYQRINIVEFNEDVKLKFGFEFYSFLESWYRGNDQPGFLFSSLQAHEIISGDRSKYLVTFTASNPEPAGGLFNVSFRTGNQGGAPVQSGPVFGQRGYRDISVQGRGMESNDISKIVYLGPAEAKKISIILDNPPRAMMINTLFSGNLPGELNLPIEDIKKTKDRFDIKEGEEILSSIPRYADSREIIVDNEDSGFVNLHITETGLLKKMLGIKRQQGELYGVINQWWAPEYWQPIIQTNYYGKYVRSAVYTRSGTGDRFIKWKGIISQPGYYDIFTYIGKANDRASLKTQNGQDDQKPESDNFYKDFNFKVYHDEGMEEITINYSDAEPGWNKLGTYYLSKDTAKVELTNKTQGRMVIGDAVKWARLK
jgi:hypothetical protein